MPETVRRSPLYTSGPPKIGNPIGKIVKIPPGPPSEWVVLTSRIVGVYTHFTADGITVPCTSDGRGGNDSCIVDHLTTSTRWQGWLGVQRPLQPIVAFLAVTPAAVRELPLLLDDKIDLRGTALMVGRSGRHAKSAMRVQLSQNQWGHARLCPAPDVRQFLENLWGASLDRAMAKRTGGRE